MCPGLSGDLDTEALHLWEQAALRACRTAEGVFTRPVRVLWGFGRWSRAQLLGELAQQEWGMCPGLSGDLDTEALHLWEQAALRACRTAECVFSTVQLLWCFKASSKASRVL